MLQKVIHWLRLLFDDEYESLYGRGEIHITHRNGQPKMQFRLSPNDIWSNSIDLSTEPQDVYLIIDRERYLVLQISGVVKETDKETLDYIDRFEKEGEIQNA